MLPEHRPPPRRKRGLNCFIRAPPFVDPETVAGNGCQSYGSCECECRDEVSCFVSRPRCSDLGYGVGSCGHVRNGCNESSCLFARSKVELIVKTILWPELWIGGSFLRSGAVEAPLHPGG